MLTYGALAGVRPGLSLCSSRASRAGPSCRVTFLTVQIEEFHEASIVIAAPAEELYAFIADMPRMGEVSPVCVGGR